jgi:CheY-like chemotaxis protein
VTDMIPMPADQIESAKILVVEDEVMTRISISDHLRQSGFTVIEAETADIAWQFLKASGSVDLVFADIETPGPLDGLQLARSIRAQFPTLPVVLTSGNERPRSYEGLGVFVAKPYRFEDIASIISDALNLERPGD